MKKGFLKFIRRLFNRSSPQVHQTSPQERFKQELKGFKGTASPAEFKKNGYPAWALKDMGYTASQIKEGGYSKKALKMAGFSSEEVDALFQEG